MLSEGKHNLLSFRWGKTDTADQHLRWEEMCHVIVAWSCCGLCSHPCLPWQCCTSSLSTHTLPPPQHFAVPDICVPCSLPRLGPTPVSVTLQRFPLEGDIWLNPSLFEFARHSRKANETAVSATVVPATSIKNVKRKKMKNCMFYSSQTGTFQEC